MVSSVAEHGYALAVKALRAEQAQRRRAKAAKRAAADSPTSKEATMMGKTAIDHTHYPFDPVYVAQLDDGRAVRMSCFCANGKLDWDRGDRLVQFVLENGDRFRGSPKPKPIKCWFEHEGRRVERPVAAKPEALEGPPQAVASGAPPDAVAGKNAAGEAPGEPGLPFGGDGS
jgi:hypothetical protein